MIDRQCASGGRLLVRVFMDGVRRRKDATSELWKLRVDNRRIAAKVYPVVIDVLMSSAAPGKRGTNLALKGRGRLRTSKHATTKELHSTH